jgi:hypothetical protein
MPPNPLVSLNADGDSATCLRGRVIVRGKSVPRLILRGSERQTAMNSRARSGSRHGHAQGLATGQHTASLHAQSGCFFCLHICATPGPLFDECLKCLGRSLLLAVCLFRGSSGRTKRRVSAVVRSRLPQSHCLRRDYTGQGIECRVAI